MFELIHISSGLHGRRHVWSSTGPSYEALELENSQDLSDGRFQLLMVYAVRSSKQRYMRLKPASVRYHSSEYYVFNECPPLKLMSKPP